MYIIKEPLNQTMEESAATFGTRASCVCPKQTVLEGEVTAGSLNGCCSMRVS